MADTFRLDEVHPVVSGNKAYKLKAYLAAALEQGKKGIVSFGGAYSNHIVATAAACAAVGLQSMGIIRGEATSARNHTLAHAQSMGMQIFFQDRRAYRNKELPAALLQTIDPEAYLMVPEGGYGTEGVKGVADLATTTALERYDYILAAVGTGTTLAGFIAAAHPHQHIVGISVLKNQFTVQFEVEQILPKQPFCKWEIVHGYHFGGYAKHNSALIEFMNELYRQNNLPTDFVYTGKLFYAAMDLMQKNFFAPNSKILVVHSGGLQGNASLAKGTLIF